MECSQSEEQRDVLLIKTLGVFDLILEGRSLLNHANRSNKIVDLLKYLITNRNKKILPEVIVEYLLPQQELSNPNNVLRSQIYRLRRTIEEIFGKDMADEYMNISFVGRHYIFTLGSKAKLDVDIFEEKVKKAKELKDQDNPKAIELYKAAVSLYKGEYLTEDAEYDWLVLSRNYYSRLFVHALFYLIEMLKSEGKYAEILEICEEGIKIEPDEEAIHIYFIEALCEMGFKKHAASHYEFTTTRLLRELGVQPTEALKNVYEKIMNNQYHGDDKSIEDVSVRGQSRRISTSAIKELREPNHQLYQPLQCNRNYFKMLFDLSKRRSGRQENADCLVIVTLINRNKSLSVESLREALNILSKGISKSLRMADIFTIWNDNQILININNIAKENFSLVSKRLNNQAEKALSSRGFYLEIEYQPILPQSQINV